MDEFNNFGCSPKVLKLKDLNPGKYNVVLLSKIQTKFCDFCIAKLEVNDVKHYTYNLIKLHKIRTPFNIVRKYLLLLNISFYAFQAITVDDELTFPFICINSSLKIDLLHLLRLLVYVQGKSWHQVNIRYIEPIRNQIHVRNTLVRFLVQFHQLINLKMALA